MTRRGLLGSPLLAFLLGPIPEQCDHSWVAGPFYIASAEGPEEAHYNFKPSGKINVEHCTKCGSMRIPKQWRRYDGQYLPPRAGR